jgi:flagellar hook protein FlgE
MRSLYSGVSGLRIHQTKMDVIGNNIANVNTVGFKSSRVTFSEVYSQTIQGASGASEFSGGKNPMQIGLGAGIASIDVNMTEGASQRTDNPLDLKIKGDGFFVVSDVTGNKFTRAGAFRIDNAGNLVTPEGLNVMGWGVDPATEKIQKGKVQPVKVLSAENAYSEPEKTTKGRIVGNINKNDEDLKTADGKIFTTDMYDELGYKYTIKYNVVMESSVSGSGTTTYDPNKYTISVASVTDEKGNVVSGPGGSVNIEFDPLTGKLNKGTTASPTASPTDFNITNFPSTGSNVFVDFSTLTLFAAKSSIEGKAGDADSIGSGSKPGSITGFEVGGDGKIRGKYSNGKSKLLGQVVVAQFDNPAGLQKVGSNLYEATNNSGEFDGIGKDIKAIGGDIKAGVLEMANVDLSKEFTEMITTQRGFQANSRIITSSDEMLQELVNLKR